ncbi:MAG TPA: hypothetical protein VNK04_01665 [Gemmataceae bacterium]|nr:hypothetical protein [Gemmataceae bacterium]
MKATICRAAQPFLDRSRGTSVRHVYLLAVVFLLDLFLTPSTQAAFVTIANPGSLHPSGGSYTSATTLLPITTPEFDTTTSLSDGTLTITFSTSMQSLTVPNSWLSWSSPPNSEGANPTVLWTQGRATLILTFSQPLQTFGFELQPNELAVFTFTANYQSGASSVGSIVQDVDGDGGARLFAAVATSPTDPFTSVTISSGGADFAIAQLRYAPAGGGIIIPAPAGLPLLVGGVLTLGASALARRWKRDRTAVR